MIDFLKIDVTYSIDTLKKHYGEFENPWDYFNKEANWSNKKLEKELVNLKNIGQKYTDEVLLPIVQNELQNITDLKFEVISQDEINQLFTKTTKLTMKMQHHQVSK